MIELAGLGKRFGPVRALDEVDLTVEEASTVAVLGANGSGKSTLLKLIAGLLRPTQGTVLVGGASPRAVRGRIGYLGHAPWVFPYLTVAENLRFYAGLYGAPRSRAEEIAGRVGLVDKAGALARTLSRGQAQRLGLARALLHDPDYLLLDEPLTGLDAAAIEQLPALVERAGRTVMITTHDRDFVSTIADRCVTLAGGRLLNS